MVLVAFMWMLYGSDDGRAYALKVDNDYVLMPERGWVLAADPESYQYPRGWLPRRVVGLTPEGVMRDAIVASVDADLWTGAVSVFYFRDTTGTLHICNVIGRRSERWLRIPPPPGP